LDQLRERARDSLEHFGGIDPQAFAKLSINLLYIDGDYGDPATYDRLKQALNGAARPLHYLAVPANIQVGIRLRGLLSKPLPSLPRSPE
jgi:glucose-6-phosphate 1-dehydrogenase